MTTYLNNWEILIENKESIRNLSLELTNRLLDPYEVKNIVTSPSNLSILGGHPWNDITLSAGYPAIILLLSEWDKISPNEGWDLKAHKYLLALQEGIKTQGYYDNISMFGGLTGIAFSIKSASRSGTRYTQFLNAINDLIISKVNNMLDEVNHKKELGVSPAWYDVIMGFSGIGRYLLEIKDNKKAKLALLNILKYLVKMTHPIEISGKIIPGWYVPQKYQFTDYDKEMFPNGNFNCGLAHGIPGPLALMSISLQHGVEVEGQKEAIQKISNWLIERVETEENGIIWPSRVSFELETNQSNVNKKPDKKRDAWCYGTAGVSRSLFLAGQALDNDTIRNWGISGFNAIFARTEESWNLDGPTFCHGLSGLLHITVRMAQDSKDDKLISYINIVLDKLLREYEPDSPFGFRDQEGNNRLHKAGLLDGVVGIALTLLSLSADKEPTWDLPFVIA